jgi:GT2 family glycosyltransferase
MADNHRLPTKIIRLAANSGGPAAPLNVGMREAQGEYVVLLDQDDLMVPSKVETAASLLSKHCTAGMFFGQMQSFSQAEGFIDVEPSRYERFLSHPACIPARWAFRDLVEQGYYYGGAGGTALRKSTWTALGGFNERLTITWDFDFALRSVMAGWDVAYAPQIVYYHRLHGKNLGQADACLRVFREIVLVLQDCARSPGLNAEERRLVRSALHRASATAAYKHRVGGEYGRAAKFCMSLARSPAGAASAATGILKVGVAWAGELVRLCSSSAVRQE